MEWSLITPFVSIIGVICGFLLSTIKEWIQNKPKVKMDMKDGTFNYYRYVQDELGQQIAEPTDADQAEYYMVKIKLDVFNYGKGNTAIKSIRAENIVDKRCLIYTEVQLTKSGEHITSFNLPASSIVTLDLEWKVEKEDLTEALFNSQKISLGNKGRLKFKINAKGIQNKRYKLITEPLSIIAAYD